MCFQKYNFLEDTLERVGWACLLPHSRRCCWVQSQTPTPNTDSIWKMLSLYCAEVVPCEGAWAWGSLLGEWALQSQSRTWGVLASIFHFFYCIIRPPSPPPKILAGRENTALASCGRSSWETQAEEGHQVWLLVCRWRCAAWQRCAFPNRMLLTLSVCVPLQTFLPSLVTYWSNCCGSDNICFSPRFHVLNWVLTTSLMFSIIWMFFKLRFLLLNVCLPSVAVYLFPVGKCAGWSGTLSWCPYVRYWLSLQYCVDLNN